MQQNGQQFTQNPSLKPIDPSVYFHVPVVSTSDPSGILNWSTQTPPNMFSSTSPMLSTSPMIAVSSDTTNYTSVSPLPMVGYTSLPTNLAPTAFPMCPQMTVSPRILTTPSPNATMFQAPSPLFLAPQMTASPDIAQVYVPGFSNLVPQMAFRSTTPEPHPNMLNPSPPNFTTNYHVPSPPMQQYRVPSPPMQQHFRPQPVFKADPAMHTFQRPQAPKEGGQRQKKYAYRSKQRKIQKVHRNIKEHFTALGLFAEEKELVRGDDTLRIHVKTFDGLSDIYSALMEIERHPEMQVMRIAAVFSKKNKYQKKGFITYLKLGSVKQRETCQDLLSQYHKNLKNVAVARKREDAAPAPDTNENIGEAGIVVPRLPRRLSASAAM